MALASADADEFHGSTRLHCDLCDAFNIMAYASGEPGNKSTHTALWHIFRPQDADKIRTFIREKYPTDDIKDPIHSQQYYLGPSTLSELRKQYGVVAYTYHQRVGDGVLIPAGCPHQVLFLYTLKSSKSLTLILFRCQIVRIASKLPVTFLL